MSVLMHLCRECRHRATSHGGADRGYSSCRCCRGAGQIDPEPVWVETFTFPGFRPEPLHRPASVWNADCMHKLILCACAPCVARYAELTGEVDQATV